MSRNSTTSDGALHGLVTVLCPEGKHGPYAVAKTQELGEVTFSLQPPVWMEASEPERGHKVILSDVTQKAAGWRAGNARFLRPADVSGGE